MTILRRHLQLFWAIAILLIGGTQFERAYADLTCHADHATEQQHTDCPTGHVCCHAPTFFATADERIALTPTTTTRHLLSRDRTPLDGPSREIDYPPQLS